MILTKGNNYIWKETPLPKGSYIVRLKDHIINHYWNNDIPVIIVADSDGGESVKLSLFMIESTKLIHKITLKANLNEYTYIDTFSQQKAMEIIDNIQSSKKFGI